jgi:hypothetical protein
VALVPPPVVTVTSTTPGLPPGEVAVIEVALFTLNDNAFAPPNLTAVAPVKLVPVIATEVPPRAVPLVGAIAVTVGAGAAGFTVSVAAVVVRRDQSSKHTVRTASDGARCVGLRNTTGLVPTNKAGQTKGVGV